MGGARKHLRKKNRVVASATSESGMVIQCAKSEDGKGHVLEFVVDPAKPKSRKNWHIHLDEETATYSLNHVALVVCFIEGDMTVLEGLPRMMSTVEHGAMDGFAYVISAGDPAEPTRHWWAVDVDNLTLVGVGPDPRRAVGPVLNPQDMIAYGTALNGYLDVVSPLKED